MDAASWCVHIRPAAKIVADHLPDAGHGPGSGS